MKKKLLILGCIMFSLVLGGCLDDETDVDDEVYSEQQTQSEEGTYKGVTANLDKRDYYTQLVGNGEDTVTVMIYMIGSDLESGESGCASDDLDEIMAATTNSNVQIVLQTGGTTDWVNPDISGGTSQRFTIEEGELVLQEDLGSLCMTDPDTLSDYVSWAADNYAADRNMLIFWDHGGGTAMGFGSDEYYEEDSMELSEIASGLKKTGVKFDFIGFDACLMGTIENAYALEPYADYLIASEELEPGTGWYYTDWISALCENTSISTEQLGKKLIDDYVSSNDGLFFSDDCTLSLIDLSGIKSAYEALCEYMNASISALQQEEFKTLSKARANTRSYGEGDFEQVDIIDYVEKAGFDEGDALKNALRAVIKYNGTNIEGSNGLAMYYPYDSPDYYANMLEEFNKINYGDSCTDYFSKFVSILTGVQSLSGNSSTPVETLTGYEGDAEEEDYSNCDWYDESYWDQYGEDYEYSDYNEHEIIDKGDYYALQLSDEEWEDISYIEMQVYLDDGEGYIDLGGDNVYNFDDDGDLMVDFDYTWVALNGQVMPYYAEQEHKDDNEWYTYGYIPAVLRRDGEEKDIEIMVYWGSDCEEGKVMGYREKTEGMSTAAKGYKSFLPTDVVCAVCDYYTYEGDYNDCYYFGDELTVGSGLTVSYEEVGDSNACAWLMLKDIYNNTFYTESVVYE